MTGREPVAVAFVVAAARGGVIGANGAIPWRLKTDMQHFRAVTMGKPVVMGRKTWESLKGPLKGRDNIVLTRDSRFRAPGAWSFPALDAALACARARAAARGADEVCIIGGAEIYALALPLADRVHLTDVDADVPGDAFMPALGPDWREVSARAVAAGPDDQHPMRFRVLERAAPA
ncbi:MAG: dihydrofolate reductase [Hyphomonadaceae bacterium]|nr:dihydrofolate reductase [Hyphomonadaceae bacterium]